MTATPAPIPAAREAVVGLCRDLVERGLVVGTAGNVSVREGDLVAVSPSGMAYTELVADDVCVHELDGTPVSTPLRTTSELALHSLVHSRPGAEPGEVVLHTHAPASTALSTVADEVPLTHYYSEFFGGAVRVAPYRRFGTDALAEVVLAALQDRSAALMGNHGAILISKTAGAALDRAAYLEYVCDIALRAMATGRPLRTLDPEEIEEVRAGLAGYGQPRPHRGERR
ncbi:class II aldolase/adducin family protein [Pseudonocardia nematodicida]|uniref:Class II aldolase/adducin family protein n=1 Tax=Pseudonocardia nematodicida TaxID=1206997 RepID=A0ABV1KEV4_9PSEU